MQRNDFDKLILHNAAVHTMDDCGAIATAVGFAGGYVTAVGPLADVRAATPGADERDLRGAAVYPGFIDAHHHLCFAATYANFPEVRTPPYRTIEEIARVIRGVADRTPEGQWIVVIGYNEGNLVERRRPTRFELDQAAPRHPVLLIHFTYHEGVLNSLGLERAGLSALPHDPPGGVLGRTRSGEPDGRVYERCFGQAEAVARAALVARDREGWFAGANTYQDRVLAAGITHVCDAAVPPSMETLYREWQARGELHLGITMMPLVENMFAVPSARLDGTPSGWRDGRLSLGALKLFTDGGTSCALCLSLRDAIVRFGILLANLLRHRSLVPWRLARQQPARYRSGKLHVGLLYYDPDELEHIIGQACRCGFGVGIHAAGNAAVAQALSALARTWRGALPPRIDHFFFAEDALIRRAVDQGTHVVVQPRQLYESADLLLQTGLPARLSFQPLRQMLDAGVVLAGSSDAPVHTFSVLAAIETAVRRRAASGKIFEAGQAVTTGDALRMYTRGAAATLGMDGEIGQLRAGARADAVVMSEEVERVPPDRLSELGVLATFAGRYELRP